MQRIVVVGGSLAGLRAVEALRQHGFRGQIVWLGEERHPPYDRPPLSKEVLCRAVAPEQLMLRKDGLSDLHVDLRFGVAATGLNVTRRVVHVGDEEVPFEGLVIATGARPRRLPGTETLGGVHVLRTIDDALAVRAALQTRPRVAIIGAGFIGAEVASSARSLGLDVTLIASLTVPLARVLGERMGEVCAALHREHGVDLRTGLTVHRLLGDGMVGGMCLSDGSEIPASLIVVGIGVVPNTEWLRGSDVLVGDGVECDATCTVLDRKGAPIPGIVAAGDVARFVNPLYGEPMRVEHWAHAAEQAEHAVTTLLGKARPFETAPMFWSDQYGIKIQFAGRSRPDDQIHVCHGSIEERRFVALYGRGGRLVAVLAFRRPAQFATYRRLIEARAPFDDLVARAR